MEERRGQREGVKGKGWEGDVRGYWENEGGMGRRK